MCAESIKSINHNKQINLNKMIEILESYGYQEMMIPVIQLSETFDKKCV